MSAEFLRIGDKKYALGLDWVDIKGSNKFLLKNALSKIVKENKVTHASLSPIINEGKSQYVLFSRFKSKEDVYAAASCFLEKYKSRIIVRKLISDDPSISKYWMLAIDANGFVLGGGDVVVVGDEDLQEEVNGLKYLLDLKVVVFSQHKEDLADLITIDEEIADSIFDDFSQHDYIKIKVYLKKERPWLKYVFIGAGVLSVCLTGYIVLKDDSQFQEIIQNKHMNKVKKLDSEIKKWKKENSGRNKKKVKTPEQLDTLAKQQLLDIFDSQFFTKGEIVENLRRAENILPLYLVEWKLTRLAYTKNNFIAVYQKIPKSNGVYKDLDSEISMISSDSGVEIRPVGLDSNGSVRTYKVGFLDNGRSDKFFMRKKVESEKVGKIVRLKTFEKKIKKDRSAMSYLVIEASQLNVFEKTFGSAVDNIARSLAGKERAVLKLYDKALSIINEEEVPIYLDASFLKGDAMKYIELTQRYITYNWGYPSSPKVFPFGKDIREAVSFARVYEISVSPVSGITTGFESMVEAADLISSDNIIYDSVEYFVEDAGWVIKFNYFEKF
jgi:hypothetical protein